MASSALGRGNRTVPLVNFLGLIIWFLDRVTMGWEGGGSVAGEGLGVIGMMWVEAGKLCMAWTLSVWSSVIREIWEAGSWAEVVSEFDVEEGSLTNNNGTVDRVSIDGCTWKIDISKSVVSWLCGEIDWVKGNYVSLKMTSQEI